MRFFTLISTCSFLVSAIAGHLPTPVQRSPNPDGLTLLTKRQFPIGPVDLTLCATVNADVDIGARLPLNLLSLPVLTQLGLVIGQTTNVRLTENLCLCVVAGALTPDTLARLRVDLADQTGVVAELLKVASVDVVLNPIVQALLVILGQRQNAPGSCTYPTGAQPICGSCDFTCAEGTFRCGDRCLANGTPCPSGISYRRRRSTVSPDLLCPKGLMACSTSFKVQGVFGRIECLDTKSNIETCGGCEFPLPGRPKGIDCSAIEGSEEVACVKGRCVVEACQSGFALVDGRRCEPLRA